MPIANNLATQRQFFWSAFSSQTFFVFITVALYIYLEFENMHTLASWEDSENHRHIQFSIDYKIENSTVVVENMTPLKVTFFCPETRTALRSVGVHTNAGQTMLCQQFVESDSLNELLLEIGKKNGLLSPAK